MTSKQLLATLVVTLIVFIVTMMRFVYSDTARYTATDGDSLEIACGDQVPAVLSAVYQYKGSGRLDVTDAVRHQLTTADNPNQLLVDVSRSALGLGDDLLGQPKGTLTVWLRCKPAGAADDRSAGDNLPGRAEGFAAHGPPFALIDHHRSGGAPHGSDLDTVGASAFPLRDGDDWEARELAMKTRHTGQLTDPHRIVRGAYRGFMTHSADVDQRGAAEFHAGNGEYAALTAGERDLNTRMRHSKWGVEERDDGYRYKTIRHAHRDPRFHVTDLANHPALDTEVAHGGHAGGWSLGGLQVANHAGNNRRPITRTASVLSHVRD